MNIEPAVSGIIERFPSYTVHQVTRSVRSHMVRPRLFVDQTCDGFARLEVRIRRKEMDSLTVPFLHVDDIRTAQGAAIGRLSSPFRVEIGLVQADCTSINRTNSRLKLRHVRLLCRWITG